MGGVATPWAFALAITPDWLTDRVGEALVGQAVVGLIALVSFFAILRRFLATEFPAAMTAVNRRLDTLHDDFEKFQADYRNTRLELERYKERQDSMRDRIERIEQRELEGTGSHFRPQGGGGQRRGGG